ncbi:hypothetical protein JW813_16755 [Clostridium botulinum]|uniref:hypothetical protein n=1 Tax=Clostridium botulinum TaxID=1491 RepID=UPI002245C49C|nr:hypothetical protein [Clostridium botulinum]UZP03337.1 hypothetical protein JW813_16755 [Clostridium botulinum]UZP06695.1 hypothetical protein JYA71_17025 [Clostridium botulinum]UZP10076.1 hypothetical protein JYA74_16750 [Clostridium botulinum]
MIKAKEIKNIKDNILKYKSLINKETIPIQIIKFKNKLKEEQYKLMDVECQLFKIDIHIYKNPELYKQIFIDKYINGLTGKQIILKYNMPRTTLYKKLSFAKKAFEYEYKI